MQASLCLFLIWQISFTDSLGMQDTEVLSMSWVCSLIFYICRKKKNTSIQLVIIAYLSELCADSLLAMKFLVVLMWSIIMHLICHLDGIRWKSSFHLAYFLKDISLLTLTVGWVSRYLISLNWIHKIICCYLPKINQEDGSVMLSVKSKKQFSWSNCLEISVKFCSMQSTHSVFHSQKIGKILRHSQ